MSDLGLTPDELIPVLYDARITLSFKIAALAIMAYDTILAFPSEVQCIWHRKLSGVTVLYILVRYVPLLEQVVEVLDGMWFANLSVSSCIVFEKLNCVFAPLFYFAIAGFSSLSYHVSTCIISPSLERLPFYATLKVLLSSPVQAHTWCCHISIPIITRAAAIASDLAVICFTWIETASIYKRSRTSGARAPTVKVLLHNGSVQFIVLLLLNSVTVLLDVLNIAVPIVGQTPSASCFIFINDALTSIVVSRFILDLRSVYLSADGDQQTQPSVSTVHFASVIAGNIGASLHGSWATGDPRHNVGQEAEQEEAEQEALEVYSDNPLAVGLLDDDPTIA
ncbi:unnamed protein product [Somion occarium]|uniref:DUF6533 domain-containing protein n=1 Tax=Somion occarium TaxID=3059160 RepID=A0ABP1CRW7_9APHY